MAELRVPNRGEKFVIAESVLPQHRQADIIHKFQATIGQVLAYDPAHDAYKVVACGVDVVEGHGVDVNNIVSWIKRDGLDWKLYDIRSGLKAKTPE